MDTHSSLRSERNPDGIGIYSAAFGESSLSDAMQQTAARGFNPMKYAGGSNIPNFAPQTFYDPADATGKYTLRSGGLTYQFSSEKEKLEWIKQQQGHGDPGRGKTSNNSPSYVKPFRKMDRESPQFYDSSAKPGEKGYRESNKPKDLLPLDRSSSITVGRTRRIRQ